MYTSIYSIYSHDDTNYVSLKLTDTVSYILTISRIWGSGALGKLIFSKGGANQKFLGITEVEDRTIISSNLKELNVQVSLMVNWAPSMKSLKMLPSLVLLVEWNLNWNFISFIISLENIIYYLYLYNISAF